MTQEVSANKKFSPDYATPRRAGVQDTTPRERMWPAMGWWKHLLVAAALAVIIGAAFANSYRSGMTLDNKYIIEEYYKALLRADKTHDLESWKQIGLIWKNDYWWPKGISGLYRPIVTLTYWLDYVVFTGKAPKHDSKFQPMKDAQGKPIPDDAWEKMSWYDYAYAPGLLNTNSYHTINGLAHWLTVVLIYFVSLCLLKRLWPAFFVAALFAAHPVTTETVTNIIGRADQFAAICVFGGLLVYIRSTKSRWFWRTPWLVLLMLVCGFGFFSKESSIAIGIIVPLYWFTFVFGWEKLGLWLLAIVELVVVFIAANMAERNHDLVHMVLIAFVCLLPVGAWLFWCIVKRELREYAPVLIEAAVWLVMVPPLLGMVGTRSWVFANSSPPETPFLDNPIRGIWMVRDLELPSFEAELAAKPLPGMSFIECKMTAVKIMGKLLLLVAWPVTLCSDYSWAEIPNFSFRFVNGFEDFKAVVALLSLLGIIALSFWLYRRGHKAAFFYIWFFFFAAMPTSNLFITIGSVMAERFMYLPLAGFTGIVALAVFQFARYLARRFELNEPADVARFGFLAGTLLSLVVVLYGVRAFLRNYAWESDITLWEAAIKDSPRSFRCYQSLAFAYYEENPIGNIDKMIRIAEGARPLVDPLPHHLNSSRLYLHLGMYYSIKGELLSVRRPDGSMTIGPDAQEWYRKAIDVLERGSLVDRSFNEVNKKKQQLRGDAPDVISDAGLGPVYGTLGMAYARLQRYDEAIRRFTYQRQLDPSEIDSYVKIASVQLAQNRYDDAAIAVIQCILMDGSRSEFWLTLNQIYSAYGERAYGALIQEGNQVKLNLSHPMVRDHLVQAYRGFIRLFRYAHRMDAAKQARKVAVEQYGFPANLFDPLFDEPIHVVTPDGIQYDQLDPASPKPAK